MKPAYAIETSSPWINSIFSPSTRGSLRNSSMVIGAAVVLISGIVR
jgi:hypothetical protein